MSIPLSGQLPDQEREIIANMEITHQSPPVNEYIQLRIEVGWGALHSDLAESSFKNSMYQVCLKENDLLIGYGRLTEENAFTIYVQDIMIKPSYQGKGLGTKIMEDIMLYIKNNSPQGRMLRLLASSGKENFYKRFGFVKKPNEKYTSEMIQIL